MSPSVLAQARSYATRVKVRRGNVWEDITSHVVRGTITYSNEDAVSTLDLELLDGAEYDSLVPRDRTSALNTFDGLYMPLLDRYNEISVEAAVSYDGTPPTDFLPLFRGWLGDSTGTEHDSESGVTITLMARDYAKQLQDDYIMDDGPEYGPGYASDIINSILEDRYNAGELPTKIVLKVIGEDDFWIDEPFQPRYQSTWDVIQEFAKQSNKDIRFLLDEQTGDFRLTYWTPTTTMVPGWIVNASDVEREFLEVSDVGNRYKVTVRWRDAEGQLQETVRSAPEYRKPDEPMRHALIEEGDTTLITNETAAGNLTQAMLDAFKSSPATNHLIVPFNPYMKVHDVMQITNPTVRSEPEVYAIEELRLDFNLERWTTDIISSETVKLRPAYWQGLEAKTGVNDPIRPEDIAPFGLLPVPTGVIAGPVDGGGISVVWDAPPNVRDWSLSIVRVRDASDVLVAGRMAKGTSLEINYPLQPDTEYFVTVSHQDIKRRETAESAPIAVTSGSEGETPDITPPSKPTGLRAIPILKGFFLHWNTVPAPPPVDRYEVQLAHRVAPEAAWSEWETLSDAIRSNMTNAEGLDGDLEYRYRVRGISRWDIDGVWSDPEVIGKPGKVSLSEDIIDELDRMEIWDRAEAIEADGRLLVEKLKGLIERNQLDEGIRGELDLIDETRTTLALDPDDPEQFSAIRQNAEEIVSEVARIEDALDETDPNLMEYASIKQTAQQIVETVARLDGEAGTTQFATIQQLASDITSIVARLDGDGARFTTIQQNADAISSIATDITNLGADVSAVMQTASELSQTVAKQEYTNVVTGTITAYSAPNRQITDSAATFNDVLGEYADLSGFVVQLMQGGVPGETRVVTANTNTTLTLDSAFTVAPTVGTPYRLAHVSRIASSTFQQQANLIALRVQAVDGEGNPVTAARLVIAQVDGQGRILLDAEQVIAPGTIKAEALDVTQLSAIVADMGTITAGKMQSPDGKFVVDLDNKTISIEV